MISTGGVSDWLLLDALVSLDDDEDPLPFWMLEELIGSTELLLDPIVPSELQDDDEGVMLEETGSSTGPVDASSSQATRNAVKARAKNPKRLIFYSFTHP